MSIDLKTVSDDELKALESRLSVTLMKVKAEIIRVQKKLEARRQKVSSSSQVLAAIKEELENAQKGLTALQTLNAPAADLTRQQALVQSREDAYEKALFDGANYTQTSAAEEEYELDILKLSVASREQQIATVLAELATR